MNLSKSEKTRIKSTYGEWAVITGATSGIGLELAHQLASAGLNLIIISRNQNSLQTTSDELTRKFGINVEIIATDVSEKDAVEMILKHTQEHKVGLLLLSAGFGTSGYFINSSIQEEIRMLRTNCESVMKLAYHFGQRFVLQKRGGIIFLSSIVAFQGTPFASHYAATKAYVQSLAEGLAVELKVHGVDVLAAAPGPVQSGFGKRANMKMSLSMHPSEVGVPILKALGRKTTVFPGFLTKFLIYSLRTVPRWAKTRIMGKVMGGMTIHQRT